MFYPDDVKRLLGECRTLADLLKENRWKDQQKILRQCTNVREAMTELRKGWESSRECRPQKTILEKARATIPMVYVSQEDLRELRNSGIWAVGRLTIRNRNCPDYAEAARICEREFPSLGITETSDLNEVVTKLYVGSAVERVPF